MSFWSLVVVVFFFLTLILYAWMKHKMKEKLWIICCCNCNFGCCMLFCTCQINILAKQKWEHMELLICQHLWVFDLDRHIFTLQTNFYMQSVGKSLVEWGSRIKVAIVTDLFPSITLKNGYVNLDQLSPYSEMWLHEIEIGLFPSVCGNTWSSVMSRDCSWKCKWTFARTCLWDTRFSRSDICNAILFQK